MNLNTGEPRDGDFVAYIKRLELRQLQGMDVPHGLAFPTTGGKDELSRSEAQTVQARRDAQGGPATRYVGALVLGTIGLALAVGGFLGHQGYLLGLLGLFVLWQAGKSALRAQAHPGADGNIQERFGTGPDRRA